MSADSPQVKTVFGNAQEIDSPAERAAYLDQACIGNDALRTEVEELLSAANQAGSFLNSPVSPHPNMYEPTLDTSPLSERPGSLIGPYKLLQQIGEGGFGVVYLAEQERPVRRMTALKIIKPGMDTREVIARFEAERQALALMDHQSIARVLDAGATDTGRPYFVMELVKGIPITEYCNNNKLTPRERLELFVPVCQAIQHAHQKGIIHRDIKPSNVLVCLYDGKPVPKIIDFGVAKAIEQRLTEKTMFTRHGQVVGTLEYMSPEQAELSQLDIDTRSDIYSLGVLLYELLTGTTPITKEQLRQAGFAEMLRMIRETEPDKPSTRLSRSHETLATVSAQRRTEPKKLGAIIKGELDWIVMKALEKDRTRRYDTAVGLAKDIERYLRDEPVEACPPGVGYRVRKLVRRHRRVAAVSTIVTVLLLLVLINHFVGHFRLKEARGRAHAEAERAKEAAALALERLADADQQRKRAEQAERESQADRDRSLNAERLAREQRDRAIAAEQEAVKQRELEAQSRASAMMALARSQFEQARAIRLSAQLGRRWLALDLLKRAESVRSQEKSSITPNDAQSQLESKLPGPLPAQSEIRTEAVSALLLNDGRVVRQWDGFLHAVSPDGRFAASFAVDLAKGQAALVINDLHLGQEIATWKGEQAAAVAGSAMTLGPGGERLAVVAIDSRSIALWDVRDRKKIRALAMPNPPLPRSFAMIRNMTFSPDGRWLAGVQMREGEATVALWSMVHQSEPQTLAKVKVYPNAMPVFSSDSRRLAVATSVTTVMLWDIAESRIASEIQLPITTNGSIAFSPTRERLAVHCQSSGSSLLIWDLRENRELGRRETGSLVATTPIRFTPDGNRVAIAGSNGTLLVMDATGFEKEQGIDDGGTDGQVGFRPGQKQPLSTTLNLDHGAMPQLLAWSADGHHLLSGGLGVLKMWELAAAESLVSVRLDDKSASPGRIAFSPDGKVVAVEMRRAIEIALFDPNSGKKLRAWHNHVKVSVVSVGLRFSPDGKQLAQFGRGGLVAWDLDNVDEPIQLKTDFLVGSVGFSPDGSLLAGGSHQFKPTIWEAATGQTIWQAQGPQVGSLTEISPNGRFAVVFESFLIGENRPSTVWDPVTGQKQFELAGPTDQAYQTLGGISPDGRWILVVHTPGLFGAASPAAQTFGTGLLSQIKPDEPWFGYVWNAETAQHQFEIRGPSSMEYYAFSPDGRYLAISMRNGMIRVWDVNAAQELFDWEPSASSPETARVALHLAFTSDSTTLGISDPSAPMLHLLNLTRLRSQLEEFSLGW